MFDDFSKLQKICYKIIKNEIENEKISHAYIIESNGFSKTFEFAKAFAKYLLCQYHYSNHDKCGDCNQCNVIDNNEFLELKIIDPEGMWIKKSSIDELQEIFSRKALYSKRKVYIINNAEKLNASSSNSILKFLEEPMQDIIAILVVDNINQLIPTIISRCQIVSLCKDDTSNSNTTEVIRKSINNKEKTSEDILSSTIKVLNFIKSYEKSKLNAILNINKIWHQNFKEKNEIYDAFTIIILFYKDVLHYNLGLPLNTFFDYQEDVELISKSNKKDIIVKKINVIIELRELIKYNINANLLMDKLIISFKGCEEQ